MTSSSSVERRLGRYLIAASSSTGWTSFFSQRLKSQISNKTEQKRNIRLSVLSTTPCLNSFIVAMVAAQLEGSAWSMWSPASAYWTAATMICINRSSIDRCWIDVTVSMHHRSTLYRSMLQYWLHIDRYSIDGYSIDGYHSDRYSDITSIDDVSILWYQYQHWLILYIVRCCIHAAVSINLYSIYPYTMIDRCCINVVVSIYPAASIDAARYWFHIERCRIDRYSIDWSNDATKVATRSQHLSLMQEMNWC
jgi:hypothetical protein